jgi:hypothetical protein
VLLFGAVFPISSDGNTRLLIRSSNPARLFPISRKGNSHMADGLGRVQRAVLVCISDAIAAHPGADFDLDTATIVRGVYGTDTASKSQRVAVLRVLRCLPNGPLPGADGWYVVRHRNRRAWALLAPQPQHAGSEPPPSHPAPRHDGRLAGAMRMLASDVPGEVNAAVQACNRLLAAQNLTWSDVAALVERL